MSEVGGDDIERLASRMAMLVSEDGEADNAGRAVGQLARRLGLSGGDLKAIVLAGAGKTYRPGTSPALLKLEREVDALRRELRAAQEAAHSMRRDRDTLMEENGGLRVAMYRHRVGLRLRRLVLGLGVLGVAAVAAGVVLLTPEGAPAPGPQLRPASRGEAAVPVTRMAMVRGAGATLYRDPDATSPVLGRLAAGSRLRVQRTPWRGMMQWAEVEVDGRLGYVVTTEVEIF
ncbi:MAG: hypothetical protein IT555_14905 [Acetobacteraceae bacterium]|nr:hypothetical protein [Acetobacteraceae bacterium]